MSLVDYVFGPRLERRLVEQGLPTWTGSLLSDLLAEANLPALMGKDDIFGMSDVRGLLQWGDAMGINPDILNILGQILPTFGDEVKRQANRQNMPVFYKNWMQGNFPVVPEPPAPPQPPGGVIGPAAPRPENRQTESPGLNTRRANRRPQDPQPYANTGGLMAPSGLSQAQIVSQGPPGPVPQPPIPSGLQSQAGGASPALGGKNQSPAGQRQPIRPPRRFF